jgi:hypothetical protein
LFLNFVKKKCNDEVDMKKATFLYVQCISNGKNIYWLLFVYYYQMSLWTDNVVRMSTLKRSESYMICYGFLYTISHLIMHHMPCMFLGLEITSYIKTV